MFRIGIDDLRTLPGLASLSGNILELLVRTGHPRRIRQRRTVTYQKERCELCFLIVKGKFSRLKYLSDETSMKAGSSAAGEWIGVSELILHSEHLFDAVAAEDSEILTFSGADFGQLLEVRDFKDMMLRRLSGVVIRLHHDMEFNTPRSRIIRLLQQRIVSVDGGYQVQMTQEEIAEETGTTRETVNRFLKEQEKLGVLTTGRGVLVITDLNLLDEML